MENGRLALLLPKQKIARMQGFRGRGLMVIKEIFAGAVEELSVGGQTSDEEKPTQAPCMEISREGFTEYSWCVLAHSYFVTFGRSNMAMRVESVDDVGVPEKKANGPQFRSRGFEAPPIAPPGSMPGEMVAIELRLDRILEKVDACLAELSGRDKLQPVPTLKRQISSQSGRGNDEPCKINSSSSLRQHMVPFNSAMDRAETREMHDLSSEKDDRGNFNQVVPLRPNRKHGRVRSLDLRLASQLIDPGDLPQDDLPMHRLLRRGRCERVWEVLEDPHSSRAAWWISQMMKVIVILSVVVTNMQLSQEPITYGQASAFLETTFDMIFFLEFLCRIFSAPSKKEYIKDAFNWADVASAMGLPLRVSIGLVMEEPTEPARATIQAILLFVLPTVRFLKLLRYFETIRLLIDAFRKSLDALPVLMYTMALMVVLSSTALYLLESRSNIPSIQHSMWLCAVTMTTVGYGDVVPKSLGGYIVASILTIASVLFLAMPVGIIGHEFTICWQGRDELLSVTRAQKALLKWGYAVEDVRSLLEYVDDDGDGLLDISEFLGLFTEMRIGLRAETMTTLFTMCDTDQTGHIDYTEFLHHVFPMEAIEETRTRVSKKCRESGRKVSAALKRMNTAQSLHTISESQIGMRPSTPVKRYRVRLSAGAGGPDPKMGGPTAQLEVSYGRLYPMETPRLKIDKVDNLAKEAWHDLTQKVLEEVERAAGQECVFQVCSVISELLRQHHDPSNEIPLYERMQRREAEEAKLKEEAARHDRELAKKKAMEEWEKQKQAERHRMERYEEKRRAVARVADGMALGSLTH
eukprot:s1785_g11.t1